MRCARVEFIALSECVAKPAEQREAVAWSHADVFDLQVLAHDCTPLE